MLTTKNLVTSTIRGIKGRVKSGGERLKWCALRALHENLINMHAQKQPYTCALGGAAHAVFRLMQLVDRFRVVKLSHAATTTGY